MKKAMCRCSGTGSDGYGAPCSTCGGSGEVMVPFAEGQYVELCAHGGAPIQHGLVLSVDEHCYSILLVDGYEDADDDGLRDVPHDQVVEGERRQDTKMRVLVDHVAHQAAANVVSEDAFEQLVRAIRSTNPNGVGRND